MQCACQITIYRSQDGGMTTSRRKAYIDTAMTVPGGQCMACKIRLSRDWAVRAMHESTLHNHNIFATLTYSDANLPAGQTLDRGHLTKFHKDLRYKYPHFRNFYCGEYGDTTKRPHYHGLYFNLPTPDMKLHSKSNGHDLYTSKKLDKIWGHGHVIFAPRIDPQSAQYVAGYTKKNDKKDYQFQCPDTGEIFDRLPEFKGQSLKPGIGYNWIKRWLYDVYPRDRIIYDGSPIPPPRYYDKICEKLDPVLWEQVRKNRAQRAQQKEEERRKLANQDKSQIPYQGSARHGHTSEKILKSKKIARKSQ